MMLYRIASWERYYEVSDSKKVDGPLSWVAIRTKQDGFGFRRIASERNNCELFACWVLMVEIAARQNRKDRGKLIRDGRPLNAKGLAMMTGFPEQAFARAIEFFCDQEQGWLVCEDPPGRPADTAASDNTEGAPVVTPSTAATSPPIRTNPDTSGASGSTVQYRTIQDPDLASSPDGDDAPCLPLGGIQAAKAAPQPPAKPKPPPRPVDPLFVALARIEGSEPLQLTAPAKRSIAIALNNIKSVFPDLTADEIERRGEAYRKLMPDVTLTAHALAKHWAKCVPGASRYPHNNGASSVPDNLR